MTFTRSLFLRFLGLIYLIAFVSFWIQMEGLIGSRGILPVETLMRAAHEQIPGEYWRVPTLAWISASDAFLNGLCGAGVFCSLLLIAGLVPTVAAFLLWLLYLSLVTVSGEFLSYQWDNLLLEVGFLAIFFAPLRWRLRVPPKFFLEDPTPSPAIVWLFRWLLFRLIFESGLVKLLSGDPTWRGLTALDYHYETQPLPTWIGWYAHQLPGWFQEASVVAVFVFELAVPVLILGTRRLRAVAFFLLVPFQLLIAATGNYCFFNLLTIALCLFLLDDRFFRREPVTQKPKINFLAIGFAVVIFLISAVPIAGMFFGRAELPEEAVAVLRFAAPFRTINRYGLFARMTTERPEILVEGSLDGQNWLPYEFKYKAGDLTRRPAFVAPHQPRLDWQMWFAALENCRGNPWFVGFMSRLLEGSPPVLALLKENPFPQGPPNFIRSTVYQYHFTDRATKAADGTWWRRDEVGEYCPTLKAP